MQSGILKTGQLIQAIPLDPDVAGTVCIEYEDKGEDNVTNSAGTVVLEGLVHKTWYPLKITKNDKTDVDNFAAPGMGYAEVVSYTEARARCSAGNTANGVRVSLGFKKG